MTKRFLNSIQRLLKERKYERRKKKVVFEKIVIAILGSKLVNGKYYITKYSLMKDYPARAK